MAEGKNVLNPDREIVDMVRTGLKRNVELFGKPFCPCVPAYAHSDDTVCRGREYRETGHCHCHCGLFVE